MLPPQTPKPSLSHEPQLHHHYHQQPLIPGEKMNNPNFNPEKNTFSPPKQLHEFNNHIQNAFTTFQNNFSNFLHHIPNPSLINPNPFSLKTHFESAISNLKNHAFQTTLSNSAFGSSSLDRNQVMVRPAAQSGHSGNALAPEVLEERLAGVPVYALSNSNEQFVLISGRNSRKSLGLFCFKKEDADALLQHMKSMDPRMRNGSKVVPVALSKVLELKVAGVAFRLVPGMDQIKNAFDTRKLDTENKEIDEFDFPGVPVFQSRSLVLRSENKRYRPVFFRKEDLEDSLRRASQQQNLLNPAIRPGDIQVAALEEIIKGMKDKSTSEWDDIIFIPPGLNISTDPSQIQT